MNSTQVIKQKKLVKIGNMYRLGDHIIGCGSSCDMSFVEKVLDKKRVRAVITDPPYGVGYVENRPKDTILGKISNDTKIQNDQLQTEEEYSSFTRNWIEPIIANLEEYNQFYIFNGDLMEPALRQGMRESKLHFSQLLIWIKGGGASARKDFVPQHELIIYGWFGKHRLESKRGCSVMYYPRPHRASMHPTMKPVGLIRRLILNSTKIGETVYDPFGGSGTTLIACEQIKRKCYMVEIDPNHVATTIQRWETITGKEAVKI